MNMLKEDEQEEQSERNHVGLNDNHSEEGNEDSLVMKLIRKEEVQ